MLLDTLRFYETPEGVDLELHLAGPLVRIVAWSFDLFLQLVILAVLSALFAFLGGGIGQGLMLISFFIVTWFYPVLFEIFNQGVTPGKKMMQLQVVHDNGTPVSWSASLIRNLLRTVDFMPAMYGFGIAAMLTNPDFKRLGDLVAGTLVVYKVKVGSFDSMPEKTPKPPPVPLTLGEQKAILHFAERAPQLSPERQQELANILSPITGLKGSKGVDALLQYANWVNRG